MKGYKIFFLLFIVLNSKTKAQNTRINNYNDIGWYNYFGTFKLNSKFGIHTEYQWRREKLITAPQQNLLRLGINYQFNPKVQFRLGYALIETFPYGEIPINSFGKNFTENRAFQTITISDKNSILDFTHRFTLEQRWINTYSNASFNKENDHVFLNRLRYMFRMQAPLKGKAITAQTPYVAAYNEVFVGFGRNVNENVFDQNRVGILIGYKFNEIIRLEAGYLNQIVQLGREINGRNVYQYNNGLIINASLNLDLSGK